jgi:hypothetical protein
MLRRLANLPVGARKMSTAPVHVIKIVQAAMQSLYPLELADRSWDNVGLLLESPVQRIRQFGIKPRVLLTIDLTTAVADEALQQESGVEAIVAYRIFLIAAFIDDRSYHLSWSEILDLRRSTAEIFVKTVRCRNIRLLASY